MLKETEIFDFAEAPRTRKLDQFRTVDKYPDGREVLVFADGREYLCPSIESVRDALRSVTESVRLAEDERWRKEVDALGPDMYKPTLVDI
jgi:hypothetical protein